jgi:hypothetical protein
LKNIFNLKMAKIILKKFLTEIGGYFPSVSSSFALYPFPYADKTLTFDWDNIGTDLDRVIKRNGEKQNVRSK